MNKAILLPMLVLAGWTMLIWIWMYATRIPAMGRAGIDGAKMVGSTGKSLRDDLVAAGEVRASWVADNYNHLMEQPTIFYATALALAVMGQIRRAAAEVREQGTFTAVQGGLPFPEANALFSRGREA